MALRSEVSRPILLPREDEMRCPSCVQFRARYSGLGWGGDKGRRQVGMSPGKEQTS